MDLCPVHRLKKDFVCLDCLELVCPKCLLVGEHTGHRYTCGADKRSFSELIKVLGTFDYPDPGRVKDDGVLEKLRAAERVRSVLQQRIPTEQEAREYIHVLNSAKEALKGCPALARHDSERTKIEVLVLASDKDEEFLEDVRESVGACEDVKRVSIHTCSDDTPSLAYMSKYDAVFVYSNYPFHDKTAMGDRLAEYLESGRGVVLASCYTLQSGSYYELGGRFVEEYSPMKPGRLVQSKAAAMDQSSLNAEHPVLLGVESFHGGKGSFRIKGDVSEAASVLCRWDDGLPLVISREGRRGEGRVVLLNFFPVSDQIYEDGTKWLLDGDGRALISNSIRYVARAKI